MTSDFTVISKISNKLVELLRDNLVPDIISKRNAIALCTPYEYEDIEVGIFLYDISRDEEIPFGGRINEGNIQKYPPEVVKLCYAITPFLKSDIRYLAQEQQIVMGKIIQTMNDGFITDDICETNLKLLSLPFSEKKDIISGKNNNYTMSLFYCVSNVHIDSLRTKGIKRVNEIIFKTDYI
ncbi:MAG: DUF4255 domain-containing protein [Oscillospiraceae bacterium]|jgi:hypothetical protein|nr:DUF4255 domain-containing protein [Oscillospiraceae bacterium]